MNKKFLAAIILTVTALSSLIAGAQEGRGYMLASSCAACHGTDGKSPDAIPSLFGKDKQYLVDKLLAFKNGTASATVMNRLAKGYSDEEIDQIAAWFAGKTP